MNLCRNLFFCLCYRKVGNISFYHQCWLKNALILAGFRPTFSFVGMILSSSVKHADREKTVLIRLRLISPCDHLLLVRFWKENCILNIWHFWKLIWQPTFAERNVNSPVYGGGRDEAVRTLAEKTPSPVCADSVLVSADTWVQRALIHIVLRRQTFLECERELAFVASVCGQW